ncbi:hypothetical protein DFH11DRAFT_1629842, partial [Phellopilus nigrolimitatus]
MFHACLANFLGLSMARLRSVPQNIHSRSCTLLLHRDLQEGRRAVRTWRRNGVRVLLRPGLVGGQAQVRARQNLVL